MTIDSSFIETMQALGLQPPTNITPERFYRFPGVGKNKNNSAGWCFLFCDGSAGMYGDWSTGQINTWKSGHHQYLSATDKLAFLQQAAKARSRMKRERAKCQEKAAQRASYIWSKGVTVSLSFPYLRRKDIHAFGCRFYRGSLVMPIQDFRGRLLSLQFIDSNGGKRLLKDGQKKSAFIYVHGPWEQPKQVIICEGWATGCTLAEQYPESLVLAAIDACNLKNVALQARHYWSNAELIIAADDDRLTEGNPGITHAHEAAVVAGATVYAPVWPCNAPEHLSDFNDLAVWLKGVAA